ncbi:MAG: phage capsid protein [Cyanobacteriota bacterium]|nr:phage capsid protein [Cyanobacteriota bacterium]MDY6364369.1 phage capsid protein [Cyanobacteriota bacterium]
MAYQMAESIRQSQLELFEKNFIRTLNQTDSKLINTPAIQNMGIQGISNLSTIKDTELTEITDKGSNPDKVYENMSTENRRSVQRRFTKTYLVDNYDKTVNLICDPTSDLFQNLKEAKVRMVDRCIADAATADVYIGGPNEVATARKAADDGVMSIDAKTLKFDYENVVSPAITMFENNYVDAQSGIVLAVTGKEAQDLRNDDKYMNAFYSSQHTVDTGKITNASGFKVISFAGTQNGISEIANPILNETEGVRTNLILAPKAIAFAYEIGCLTVAPAPTKVNSFEITIDLWIKAVRRQGKKIIKVLSTI